MKTGKFGSLRDPEALQVFNLQQPPVRIFCPRSKMNTVPIIEQKDATCEAGNISYLSVDTWIN